MTHGKRTTEAGLNNGADGLPQAVFRARGVTKVYLMGEIAIHALRGVDLDLHSNELMVLLGASGSGKSTC